MRSISFPRALTARLLNGRTVRPDQRRSRSLMSCLAEGLEQRLALSTVSAATPAIQMLSATTADSKSVIIDYQVNESPTASNPIQFGVYRSSNGQFNSSDTLVSTFTPTPPGASSVQTSATLDQSGQPATIVGTHQLTIPLPGGLPPDPEKPYVLVVADPGSPSATTVASQTASFRTYTIGIVTHGGIQDTSWKNGPPWELEMAYMMKQEGYDAVIPYNWVAQSSTPGEAIKQSPRLARIILHTASQFPASDPVNLDFIGHSEGTVVNTYAIVRLESTMTPHLRAGYMVDTLLDPHAANNNLPGQQVSYAGALGGLARMIVTNYQGNANDPPAFIPAAVDQAQVFFEHTQATASGIYNLWGQVPVKSDGPVVHYFNLTDMGVTHSGKKGVASWYRNFIVPTLGNQAPLVQELQLDGQIDEARSSTTTTAASSTTDGSSLSQATLARGDRVYGPAQVVPTSQPEFSGTSAPGSIIRLLVSPAAKPWDSTLAGRTTANGSGQWSLTTSHPLRNGQYRTVVSAFSRTLTTRPGLAVIPTQPLGRLVVDASTDS
jgi:hypothetical protein